MFCPNCGKSNPDDSKFCESCGTNMLEPVVAAAPQQAFTPAPPAAPPAPAYAPPAQPAYAPPPQAQYYPPQNSAAVDPRTKPLGVGGYLGMFALNIIPFVGPLIFFIMLFVWAFGSKAQHQQKELQPGLAAFDVDHDCRLCRDLDRVLIDDDAYDPGSPGTARV